MRSICLFFSLLLATNDNRSFALSSHIHPLQTVAKMRRKLRRSIDDSIRSSAMSPRRRRSRQLNQSNNWSALNASNVTNLLDDVSVQLKESTLDETNTEHKRVFASVAIRSLLEPSFTVDLAEPKCTSITSHLYLFQYENFLKNRNALISYNCIARD